MPEHDATPQPQGPERRSSVLTETDRHAIAAIVVELMQNHSCRFKDIDPKDMTSTVSTVLATRRAAFWCGATFTGALLILAASGAVWVVAQGIRSAIHAAASTP